MPSWHKCWPLEFTMCFLFHFEGFEKKNILKYVLSPVFPNVIPVFAICSYSGLNCVLSEKFES